ncbi:MAG: MAPEG family protein [Myxococcales bacterium]|nr:MAPEG family protein [Myxococcales bacterium]
MGISIVCVAVMWLLNLAPRLVVSKEMARLPGGYNNNDPRGQQAMLEGRGKRALAAHQNTLENFPPFAAAVALAHIAHAAPGVVAALSVAYVLVRGAYIVFYLDDKAPARSSMYALGLLLVVAIFASPLFAR